MADLILHHYPTSPFAEKVRLVLGYKQLAWKSVFIPPVMPKPDVLALTEASAEAAGIVVEPDAFQPIMRTASGTGYGAPVVVDTLKLGETELRNVDAVVVQGLSTDLLGQNVLRKLGQVTLQGDRMVIQPR